MTNLNTTYDPKDTPRFYKMYLDSFKDGGTKLPWEEYVEVAKKEFNIYDLRVIEDIVAEVRDGLGVY